MVFRRSKLGSGGGEGMTKKSNRILKGDETSVFGLCRELHDVHLPNFMELYTKKSTFSHPLEWLL